MNKGIILLALGFATFTCKSPKATSPEKQQPKEVLKPVENDNLTGMAKDREELNTLFNEITKLSKSVKCEGTKNWTFVAYGSKSCGGSAGYIAYSKTINETHFLNLINQYTVAESKYNKKWGILSNCMVEPKPNGVSCKDDEAILIY